MRRSADGQYEGPRYKLNLTVTIIMARVLTVRDSNG